MAPGAARVDLLLSQLSGRGSATSKFDVPSFFSGLVRTEIVVCIITRNPLTPLHLDRRHSHFACNSVRFRHAWRWDLWADARKHRCTNAMRLSAGNGC